MRIDAVRSRSSRSEVYVYICVHTHIVRSHAHCVSGGTVAFIYYLASRRFTHESLGSALSYDRRNASVVKHSVVEKHTRPDVSTPVRLEKPPLDVTPTTLATFSFPTLNFDP